mgnify:CR=1 FL=1
MSCCPYWAVVRVLVQRVLKPVQLLLSCWSLRTAEAQGHSWLLQKHLDVGVLDQAELFLDLMKLFLLPPNVGLQDPCPLLQLVFNGLEHAELC